MGSKDQIMTATYQALCKHGYADLTIQKIADEFEKGKSLIYYHYDDKDELMLAFLDHLQEKIAADIEDMQSRDPVEQFDTFLNVALGIKNDDLWEFRKAMFEMRTQAPYNDAFAEKFQEIDDLLVTHLEHILAANDIEHAADLADLTLSTIEGGVVRHITVNDKTGLNELKQHLKQTVLNPGEAHGRHHH